MKVCVINRNGRPLMPTTPRQARLLLESGRARIVRRVSFTIQLECGSVRFQRLPATGEPGG